MNTRLTLALAAALAFGNICAQKVQPVAATAADYVPLLQTAGYDALSFDISGLADARRSISFSIREYENGRLLKDNVLPWTPSFSNMTLVSDFDSEDQAQIKPEEMADPQRGIYSLARKLTIGFVPEADSIKTVMIAVENMGASYGRLRLRPQTLPSGKEFYSYQTRPFAIGEVSEGEFTPLVLIGSVWYDPQIGAHRFCGDDEVQPDLSNEIVGHIPHFYVIGACFKAADNDN